MNSWIRAIHNRTYEDIQSIIDNPDQSAPKGAYNYFDPNRVENNTAYVLEYMLEHKIIIAAPTLRIKTDWKEDEIITASEMKRIVENVSVLCQLSNPMIQDQLPSLYLATQMNYVLANDIERALDIMHTQPELPLNYFTLTINDGLIISVVRADGSTDYIGSSICLIAEDEVATITGIPPEPDPEWKAFTVWSGSTDDLQYLGSVTAQTTTFLGQYHDVTFTANFRSAAPRALQLTNAYISPNGDDKAESGPRSGTYHAGDNIMIIADVAPFGKAFDHWSGTQEALNAISVSDVDPSTVWLAMPDCDVKLQPVYINAGQHYVSVSNGSGSGWYNYNDFVNIYADIPSGYGFDNWSGDTQYLDSIYDSSTSFRMPDVNVNLRANSSYRPGYYNIQIINGLINGQTKLYSVEEGTSLTLTPTPPTASQTQVTWTLEGAGTISGNSFRVGKGNAIITGTYEEPSPPVIRPKLTVINKDNSGETETYSESSGGMYPTIVTAQRSGNYRFVEWTENGHQLSTSNSISLPATSSRTIKAEYEYIAPPTPPPPVYNYYDVTVLNKNNEGTSTTVTKVEGSEFKDISNVLLENYVLIGYYKNSTYIPIDYSFTTYTIDFSVTSNTTIQYVYRVRETHTVSVSNGYIPTESGHVTSITKKERESVSVVANEPSSGTGFSSWEVTSGEPYALYNQSLSTLQVVIGRSNVSVRATYRNYVYLTVHTNSGTSSYYGFPGKRIDNLDANPPPTNYEFDKWDVTSGDATISNKYSGLTSAYLGNSNSVLDASYKVIPDYNIEVVNGYVQIGGSWVTSGTVKRNSDPTIKMKPAPTGTQFLQWEVLIGTQDDVYQPFAETTALKNVTHDIKVRATYYTPNPEVKYTLTVIQKDGTVEVYNCPVGDRVNVIAQAPDEGYRFYRWTGDYQYLVGGRYMADNVVNIPAKNITLQPTYVREDFVTKYHLYMFSSECQVGEDTEGTPIWSTEGEFEEGTVVNIRPTEIPYGWRFNGWEGANQAQTALVNNINREETYLTMSNFDVQMTATIIDEAKYTMKINNGQTSGEYYGHSRVDVYFDKENTDTEHYTFTRWTGDVTDLELYEGGVFDVTHAGTSTEPQYVKMPLKKVEITGEYTSAYKLSVTGGHIDGTQEEYFASGTVVNIVADVPEGKIFQRWDGDTTGIGSILNPTTTITMGDSAKNLTAVFSNIDSRNDIGYGLISFIASDIISISNITIISGTIRVGFIITDIRGHMYVVTAVNADTVNVVRLTKISKGGEVYE